MTFHNGINSITADFTVYLDRLLNNLLQLFAHTENSEWFSLFSFFWGQHCFWTETNILENNFFM